MPTTTVITTPNFSLMTATQALILTVPISKGLSKRWRTEKIGTVIVKDLSRFGREYLQTGFYTEMFLPDNDVRFIAINDSVDSDDGDNDFAPFKNIINEWYAKDCSKKIRAVMKMKAQRGDCLTGIAPYGYMKDPNDKTKLIPSDRADYVKMMYRMAIEGCSCGEIATKMRSMNLPIPKADYYIRNGLENCASYPKYPYYWLKATVKTILLNPVYTGRTVALKYTNKSYKNKKRIERPEDEWVITENTHEALVSREDYDTVYKRLSVKTRDKVTNPDNIFRGLVMCPDCGKVHGFSKRYDNRNSKGAYRCQTAIICFCLLRHSMMKQIILCLLQQTGSAHTALWIWSCSSKISELSLQNRKMLRAAELCPEMLKIILIIL